MEHRKIISKNYLKNCLFSESLPDIYLKIAKEIEFENIDLETYSLEYWENLYPNNPKLVRVLMKANNQKYYNFKHTFKKQNGSFTITFD